MDSKWIKMLLNENDQYKKDATRDNHVDLSLKLGLPDVDEQHVYSAPNMTNNFNNNLNVTNFSEGTNNEKESRINEKGKGVLVDVVTNFEAKTTAFNNDNNVVELDDPYYAWPPSKVARDVFFKRQRLDELPGPFPGSSSSLNPGAVGPLFTTNYGGRDPTVTNNSSAGAVVPPFTTSNNPYAVYPDLLMNIEHQKQQQQQNIPPPPPHQKQQQQQQNIPPPPPPPQEATDHFTVIDVPARRMERERAAREGLASDYRRQQRYNGPNKRCTNYNCNTNDTPMWRRGPLGQGTLCNACGIKYRKDEEKRQKESRRKYKGESSKARRSNA